MDYLGLALRWLHIMAAIIAAGGSVFMLCVVLPSAKRLSDDARKELLANVRGRWSKIIMGAFAVLLVTGLINFFNIRELFHTESSKLPKIYNIVFGIKVLLAFAIMFLASALVGRSAAFDKIRANAKCWLTVNVGLILIVVALSGILRSTHIYPKAATALPSETPAPVQQSPQAPAQN